MSSAAEAEVWRKIERLQNDLKQISPRSGYSEVRKPDGSVMKYRVHTLLGTDPVIGDKEIPVLGGAEGSFEAAKKVLEELERLVMHYKIQIPWMHRAKVTDVSPEPWLGTEAKDFWNAAVRGHLPEGMNIYRFGNGVVIRGAGESGDAAEYRTKEQIIWASCTSGRIRIEAFRYLPTSRKAYKNDAQYHGAMDYNHSMYVYIEQKKMPPSDARDRLTVVNKELIESLILEFFKGHNPFPSFVNF
jgi:hypothetical protein